LENRFLSYQRFGEVFLKGSIFIQLTAQDIEHFKMERLKETVGDKTVSNATVNRQLDTFKRNAQ